MTKEDKEYVLQALNYALDNGTFDNIETSFNLFANAINIIDNEPTSEGWIKINSEDDLPKNQPIDIIINNEPYQGYVYEGRNEWFCIIDNRYNSTEIEDCVNTSLITHYQKIKELPKPIY